MTELAERAGCAVTSEREGDRVRLVPSGLFDLAHAPSIERSLEEVESELGRSEKIEISLAHIEHLDRAGAVLLARLIDRLDAAGRHVRVVERENPEAARLIALYRERRGASPEPGPTPRDPLARIGAAAAALPGPGRFRAA